MLCVSPRINNLISVSSDLLVRRLLTPPPPPPPLLLLLSGVLSSCLVSGFTINPMSRTPFRGSYCIITARRHAIARCMLSPCVCPPQVSFLSIRTRIITQTTPYLLQARSSALVMDNDYCAAVDMNSTGTARRTVVCDRRASRFHSVSAVEFDVT